MLDESFFVANLNWKPKFDTLYTAGFSAIHFALTRVQSLTEIRGKGLTALPIDQHLTQRLEYVRGYLGALGSREVGTSRDISACSDAGNDL